MATMMMMMTMMKTLKRTSQRRWRQHMKVAASRRQSDAHSTPADVAPFGTLRKMEKK
jgi:hypothetical protein